MYDLIMREHQNVFFTVSVFEAERQLMVIVFSEIRVDFHILKKIIHPSHVPFIGETESALFR